MIKLSNIVVSLTPTNSHFINHYIANYFLKEVHTFIHKYITTFNKDIQRDQTKNG